MDQPFAEPDITLTLDVEGVIQDAVASGDLNQERLDPWRGLSWKETVTSASGPNVARLIEATQRASRSACLQVSQVLPSGRETPIEYTMINLGKSRGFVAIGRSLQAIADLQARLVEAQQARERDYWKLRDVETRYRAVLEASHDAVVLVRPANLRVVEANAEAFRALKLRAGAEFLPELGARDRRALENALVAARTRGRAPGIVLHPSPDAPWSLRASLVASEAGQFYLFHMAPIGGAEAEAEPISLDAILQRFPDAFAVVDRDGVIRRANDAFLDLAQLGVENAALGQNLKRWLSQPGADASVLLNFVHRNGQVRRLASRIEGEVGSSVDVEVSAVGNRDGQADYVGLMLREAPAPASASEAAPDLTLPGATLEEIVRASVEAIERRGIHEAIVKAFGNRTLAAKYLGISRQSLHMKLRRYRIDAD
jgi:transcriptional regulator PpsR